MKESKFYQEILQEGREEGREEGRFNTRRADIVRVLRARFRVHPPLEVATALDALDDLAVLDGLLDLAATCGDIAAFQGGLPQRQTV